MQVDENKNYSFLQFRSVTRPLDEPLYITKPAYFYISVKYQVIFVWFLEDLVLLKNHSSHARNGST